VGFILQHTVSMYTLTRMKINYFNIKFITVPMKFFGIIKMCSNEIYSEVHMGKRLTEALPILNGQKKEDVLLVCFKFCLEVLEFEEDISAHGLCRRC
jgi:hypothetical protein